MPPVSRPPPPPAAAAVAANGTRKILLAQVPVASAETPVMTAQLTLEDVARDAFRRKFFLDAFADEKEALELSFSFLQRIRQYKQLVGKRDALQSIAEELVAVYLRDPPPHLCVFLRSPAVTALLNRIFVAVQSQRSTPDLFSGMESHVNDRLEKEKFVAFLQTPQFAQLCDALRKRRELPLGEILVDARRTHFLEQFLQQQQAGGIGNLRFWVEVQTVFLPLIQTNAVSVALFEEIQATVRRLYNQYIVVSSPSAATAVPEALRSDILKRIMQLQGEPFSPSRYATLFRQAQEKIWHWLQTIVYNKFQASMFYVALVVETENLESDRQLRKLSEHVQARATPATAAPAVATQATLIQPKLSAIVVPVEETDTQGLSTSEFRFLRVVAPLLSSGEENTTEIVWRKSLVTPTELTAEGIRSVWVVRVADVSPDGQLELDRELRVADSSGEDDLDLMDFLWNWRETISIPTALSPSHRPQPSAPQPAFRSFSLPAKGNERTTLHGYAVITWHPSQKAKSISSSSAQRDSVDATTDDVSSSRTRSGGFAVSIDSSSADHQSLFPRFTYALASRPQERRRIVGALVKLSELSTDAIQELDLCGLFRAEATPLVSRSVRLNAKISSFYLQSQLASSPLPVNWIFKELSHQTVVTLLGALLVGRSVVIVCPRPASLMLVATALVELLRPFEWRHLLLPLCPVRTACALADRTFFVSPSSSRSDITQTQSPFIIGLEAELTHLKTKDSANEPRHRIRNSIYSVQRVSLHLQPPRSPHPHATPCQDAESLAYPTEILHTNAIVLDVDADDVYIPDRVEIPEFPQSFVRSLETAVKDAMLGGGLTTADSRMFMSPATEPAFVSAMLEPSTSPETEGSVSPVDTVRLALVSFLEELFGDVVFYFCSFRKSFTRPPAASAGPDSSILSVASPVAADALATFVIFEADAFLDAKIEVGCRDFFRQVFQTELFRQFILRQHQHFGVH